jgi:predicted ArsR family transcriptional regulator
VDIPSGVEEEALAQPTRARIFAFLVDRRAAISTDEIAAGLALHPNGVRRHLEKLEAAKLVERRQDRGQRGRPRDRWLVAPEARPSGRSPSAYSDLARWLARSIPADANRRREIEEAGFEIGRELAPMDNAPLAETVSATFAALGFQPELDVEADGSFTCRLNNCPYRDSVRENAEIICTLHRGITSGLLSCLTPQAEVTHFEPHDPYTAGCLIGVTLREVD